MELAAVGLITAIIIALVIRSVYESYSRQRLRRRIEYIVVSDSPRRKT
jgi:cellobiose-specific phosphotransferase system component IIC